MSSYGEDDMEHLSYPIGRFAAKENRTAEERNQDIQMIGRLSAGLSEAVRPLTSEQLNTPYRPGGWSVAQVVHHLSDTNMFAYLRFKRGLTEDAPQISTYRQDLWAEQSDYLEEPIESSLRLMEHLNPRFMTLLGSLSEADFARIFVSAGLGTMSLDTAIQRYIWHNSHHIAQITSLIKRSGW
ncbi:YfiT family bacillithiol transferase [Paenibacillus pedocola]|uniref:YfiT family bacillithiol transferase n=1 Tax=Paenibacillus pedocola TaxID=3242193 RepID=UPI002877A4E7|nr:putative metal-dependent hydrolase [Paenibacillus typhae]